MAVKLEWYIKAAEACDALRIFPRLFVCCFLATVLGIVWAGWFWFTGLPADERTATAAGMAVGLVGALGATGAILVPSYFNTGIKWQDYRKMRAELALLDMPDELDPDDED